MKERPEKELKKDAPDEIREEDLPDEDVDLDGLLAQDEPEPKDASEEGHEEESNDQEDQSTDSVTIDEEDEIGIPLNDDELWDDDSGLDEIPLFEDELDQIEGEEGQDDAEETIPSEQSEDLVEDSLDTDLAGQIVDKDVENESTPSADPDNGNEAQEGTAAVHDPQDESLAEHSKNWLAWFVTGISGLLILAGVFALHRLYTAPYPVQERTNTNQISSPALIKKTNAPEQVSKPRYPKEKKNQVSGKAEATNHYQSGGQWEVMALAPFLIPAYQAGELVFFKVQVSLTIPDIDTKRAFLRQEARIRNIIYQGLKGMEVQPGYGNVLYQYRRPLMDELNRALAPLKVIDLKLTGYLMK